MNSRPLGKPRLYDARWRAKSRAYLKLHPLCVYCLTRGHQVRSTIVDHKVPHRGNLRLFWLESNWQAMCEDCHNSAKQAEERLGRVIGCDEQGIPLDQNHHWAGRRGGVPAS